jgi:hypothetical protein
MSVKTSKAKLTKPSQPYQPSEREKAAKDAFNLRKSVRPRMARVKVENSKDGANVLFDHPDQATATMLLLDMLATDEADFADGLVRQLANVGSKGKEISETNLNHLLSIVKAVGPRDEVESLLASQMAAVHLATMAFARRLANVETINQQDSAERAFNKLARTFTVQMETLKRYRSKGEQRVVVQHQHVNVAAQNAQVNVGGAPEGGGEGNFSEDQPHEPKPEHLGYAPSAAMPSEVEANKETVPRSSR